MKTRFKHNLSYLDYCPFKPVWFLQTLSVFKILNTYKVSYQKMSVELVSFLDNLRLLHHAHLKMHHILQSFILWHLGYWLGHLN